MARLSRVCPVGVPQHVMQRGNNRQVCFADEQDLAAYAHWLTEASRKYQVDVHAWVFMTNHIHLLCTPQVENAVSRMMQTLGRQFVRYFNSRYQRTGTLWEGRYKSCLVQEEIYLLALYRYIELNPVRAGIVEQPSDYVWSSYASNAQGKVSELCTPHALYVALGNAESERQARYRQLFEQHVEGELLTEIRQTLNKGLALGNERFKAEIEKLTGRRVTARKAGRPAGWRKKDKVCE
ncbi:transposase [Nitrosomonas halophila]|jgi:putative transposase|uniref:Putative transposase n=1 Tax=Nitrosomonas halophila TaxID=44576 RepID=A0A1H3ILX1_9PROT|nr:transposase [Nitrosomonas halophila]SDY28682.1 putative transposase [Nitrosomonas halophila]